MLLARSLALSLPHFALEPPPAFTFFRLGFRFPKSFSYSSAVDEEGVVVEFWRSTTTSRRRRERERETAKRAFRVSSVLVLLECT
jgi:hypothetical protein